MQESNPYESPTDASKAAMPNQSPRSRARWTIIGFALGAAVPVAFGTYGMHQHNIYLASLGQNEAACGTGAIGAMAMIFIVGPVCGMIGAGSGWIAAGIDWLAAL